MLEYGHIWSRTTVGRTQVSHTNGLPITIPSEASKVINVFPTTYLGNTTLPTSATALDLACGESRVGADFSLNSVPGGSVTGTIIGPNGPLGLAIVRLVPLGAEEMPTTLGFESAVTASASNGSFDFQGVPAGTYTIRVLHIQTSSNPLLSRDIAAALLASPMERQVERELIAALNPPPSAPTLFGSLTVTVADVALRDVRVVLSEAARVRGILVFDGEGPRPPPEDVRLGIGLIRADGRGLDVMKGGWVTRSGIFSTYGSPPGRYYARVLGGVPGWSVESVRLGEQDLLDLPIEATVLVFPEDPRLWSVPEVAASRFRVGRTTTKGLFRIDQLRPGAYLVAAVPDSRVAGWKKESQLNALAPLAVAVRVQNSGPSNVTLNTIVKR